MSTALASARRRRAVPETVAQQPGVRQTTPQPSFAGQPQPNMGAGLTLPQVIALVDKRLSALESFMQTQANNQHNNHFEEELQRIKSITEEWNDRFDEYNGRFDIVADELALLKDTVLKLQTYTMEVNKMLMEERVRILSTDEQSPLEQALSDGL